MRFLYNFLFTVFFFLTAPFYFLKMLRRGNWVAGFGQRFGNYDTKIKQSLTNRQVLWIHAVSVGELNICIRLVQALEPRIPNVKIMVSTTTTTGMGELQKRLPANVSKIYYPVDCRKYVSRAMASLHPNAIILVESEIWPNFIIRARNTGTPLFLVNARLSDRSYPRFKRFGFIFRRLFAAFAAVGAQNQADAGKLRELGCTASAVRVIGNLKFDVPPLPEVRPIDVPALFAQLGILPGAPVIVAGSTHAGEEAILAEQLPRLRKKFPNLVLVLVPRHFERARDVGQILSRRGIKYVYRSEITPATRRNPGSLQCLLVNTTGELRFFYEHATVVFVGKSLTAKGGQNPIEPAALAKPVVFGPNMQNFADVTSIFLAEDAVVQVRRAADLEPTFAELLAQPERCAELGRKAQRIVQENQGAVDRTIEMMLPILEKNEMYVVPKK